MKHLFIVNPVAGGSDKTGLVSARVSEYFSGREAKFEVYTTKGPMDACAKVRREAAENAQLRVYACGGDGTLNECVCGAAGCSNAAVTSYPTGTGNDFIKMFGAESGRFFDLAELVEGETRPLDYILCNGRPCINICSVGIDARIGTDVHKYSSIPLIGGATGYITSLAVNLAKGIATPLRVTCGGKVYAGGMSLICACNGSFYGGGFNPVPEARPDDGMIDFLIVKGISRLGFLRLVGRYAKGGYAQFPKYITHVRETEMVIDSEKDIVVNIDGEAIYSKHIVLEAVPGGVNFIFPAKMAYFENAREKTEAMA